MFQNQDSRDGMWVLRVGEDGLHEPTGRQEEGKLGNSRSPCFLHEIDSLGAV